MNQRTIKANCDKCGMTFDLRQSQIGGEGGYWYPETAICPTCDQAAVEAARARNIEPIPRWKTRFEAIAPPEFLRPIDRSRLPDPNAFDRALEWRPSDTLSSICLVGPTGTGKTRAAYALLREMMRARPAMSIEHFNCVSFGENARARAYTGKGAEWFERLKEVDLVFFDDLFRGVLNDQTQEELFGLISVRTERHAPIIATTQFTGKTLENVLRGHHAAALSRRIGEFFELVQFRQPQR